MSNLDPSSDDVSPRSLLQRLFPRKVKAELSAETEPAESSQEVRDTETEDPGSSNLSKAASLAEIEQSRDTSAAVPQGQESADSAMILRGTSRGLEVHIQKDPPAGEILAKQFQKELSRSPDFFSGGDVILRFASAPDPGTITALEQVAREFSLRIVALSSDSIENAKPLAPKLSSRKSKADAKNESAGTSSAYPLPVTRFMDSPPEDQAPTISPIAPMMVAGPIRSGACFEAPGHLVIMGDVNPGAEIRAAGNIVVLGSLRGIAHAGFDGQPSFILAMQLQPQQLRIGSLIARAGDADGPAVGAEIAYADKQMIVVDEYQGRLPAKISRSI